MWTSTTAGLIVACFSAAFIQGSLGVEFEDSPREARAEAGTAVLIRCTALSRVAACQWYWAALDGDPRQPVVAASVPVVAASVPVVAASVPVVAASVPVVAASVPVVVASFPAYGADGRSCSVRFKAVRAAQEGLWVCGAREGDDGEYDMAPPFKLTVVPPVATTTTTSAPPLRQVVEFAEVSQDHAVKVGMPMHLVCRTAEAVDECLWSWRAEETETEIPVKEVEPFGDLRLNCDLRFEHVSPRHGGVWTCAAKLRAHPAFTRARAIRIAIRKEVGFVQLSQDIQVAYGEPVLLRCVTNTAVDQCQWVWQGFSEASNATLDVVKRFPPYGEAARDCSVRFRSVLQEHAGVWTCEARLHADADFSPAPPARLTILYPAKAAFTEDPQDTAAVLGGPVTLRCVASLPAVECRWTWRPDHDNFTSPLLIKSFPPFDNASRDCSVRFKAVLQEQQGIWGCHVTGSATNDTVASRLARLTVYEKGTVSFEQLTQEILIYPGGPLALRCTTSLKVDICRWSWQPPTDPAVEPQIYRQFSPADEAGRDCTIRLWNVKLEQRGVWTCSVKQHNEDNFTQAAPTRVTVMQPESVTVALWTSPDSSVSLACRLTAPQLEATCRWYHPPHVNVSEANHTQRYAVQHSTSTGVCTLTFSPGPQDLGQWTCGFSVDTEAGEWEMASANLILLTTTTPGFTVSEDRMGWLIGVLAVMVLVLTTTLVAVALCKCRPASEDGGGGGGGGGLAASSQAAAAVTAQDPKRYTDPPTKIAFQFGDPAAAAVAAAARGDAEVVLASSLAHAHAANAQHIYEKVGRYATQPAMCKSIYENVD